MATKLTQIQNMIYEIRGQKVMLDSDLATLYEGVFALEKTDPFGFQIATFSLLL
jgi:hypothetical protein